MQESVHVTNILDSFVQKSRPQNSNWEPTSDRPVHSAFADIAGLYVYLKRGFISNNPTEQSNKGTRECVIAAIIQVRTFCSEVSEQPLLLASSGPARDFSCNSASHSSVRQIYTLAFYCWIANVTQIEACTCRLPFL